MNRPKIYVLYECTAALRPHASASLRLIRPLTHPGVRDELDVTFGFQLGVEKCDLVFVDRLWKPGITPRMVNDLARAVRRQGARLIYWFDDNFRELGKQGKISEQAAQSFERLVEVSDGLVVSTQALKDAFGSRPNVVFLPSALDERLLVRRPAHPVGEQVVLGYMGSATHDDDLRLALPALRDIHRRYPGRVRFQFVGVLNAEKRAALRAETQLPIEILQPMAYESEYQQFMLWFTGSTHWDLAIAPLVDTPFNRSKSDIKFLDYAAAGVPGVFSAVAAYPATVTDHHNGLLVNSDPSAWSAALVELIENPSLREKLRGNAAAYLYQHRVLAHCARNWLEVSRAMLG